MCVTYLGHEIIEAPNLTCLIGRSQTIVNRLCARYDEGAINDMIRLFYFSFPFMNLFPLSPSFSFFRESWATMLYHDRFPAFLSSLESELLDSTEMGSVARALAIATVQPTSPSHISSAAPSPLRATSLAASQRKKQKQVTGPIPVAATPAQFAHVLRQVPRKFALTLEMRLVEFMRLYREQLPHFLIPEIKGRKEK